MSLQSHFFMVLLDTIKELQARNLSASDINNILTSDERFKKFLDHFPGLVSVIFNEAGSASAEDIMDSYTAFTASPPTTTPAPTPGPTAAPTLESCTPISNNTQLEFPPLIFSDDIGSNIASGIRIIGGASTGAGSSIAVGYINDDCIEDIIIGAPKAKKIYVVMGSALTAPSLNVDAIETGAIPGLVIQSETISTFSLVQNNFGRSIASGDMNLDGYDDIAFTANDVVCIVFGGANLPKIINLSDIVSSNLGVCTPATNPLHITITDFNGDGPNDLIVPDNDQLKIFLGDISLSSATNLTDYLLGIRLTNYTGYSYEWASAVGDLNGDHKQDLLVIGSPFPDVIVLFGIGNITVPSELDPFTGDISGVFLDGSYIPSFVPNSPSKNSGDFNGDGNNDIAISNQYNLDTLIIYGPFDSDHNYIDLSTIGTVGDNKGVLFPGSELLNRFGDLSSKTVGSLFKDLNNDNITDFIIGYTGETDRINGLQNGMAYIIFGNNNSYAEIILLNNSEVISIEGGHPGFGSSLASCDANRDGIPDLLVGAPFVSQDFDRRAAGGPAPTPTAPHDDNVFIFFGE